MQPITTNKTNTNSYKYKIMLIVPATPSHSPLLVASGLPELLMWERPRAQNLTSFPSTFAAVVISSSLRL